LDMQRVAKLADAKHPLLVGQLFDPVMLLEISKWEEIEERLKCREGEDEFESAREGTVYFSDTPSMQGSIMKIGGSKYDGHTRARTLYDAGVPEPFTCRLEMRFSDWKLYERTIQEYLSNVRVYSNKEFFVVTIHEAQKILNQIDGSACRTEEETIRWNRAFSNTKTKIEKYRRIWQLKKDELEKMNPAKEEQNKLIQELGAMKRQCEILTQERDRALTYIESMDCLVSSIERKDAKLKQMKAELAALKQMDAELAAQKQNAKSVAHIRRYGDTAAQYAHRTPL
jgi:hypothetical protein